jgi:hypothetical protein
VAGRAKRALIGCGIGCGVLIVVSVIAAIGFGAWVSRKGEPLEPRRLLGSDTTAYAEWTLRIEDPGTEGFVQRLIEDLEEIQAGQTAELPPWMAGWIGQRRRGELDRDIREFFPVVGAWTLAPGPGAGEDETLYSVSPTGLGNRLSLIDWGFSFVVGFGGDTVIHEYADEKIYRIPSGSESTLTFFIRDNTFFLTSDLTAAKVGVDRLGAGELAERTATRLDRLFDETSPTRTLRGAVTNDRGEIPRLWEQISGRDEHELFEQARGLTLEGGLRDDGSLAGVVRVTGPDAGWATEHAEQLSEIATSGLAWLELDLRVSAVAEGDTVRIDLRATDLADLLGRMAGEHESSSRIRIEL